MERRSVSGLPFSFRATTGSLPRHRVWVGLVYPDFTHGVSCRGPLSLSVPPLTGTVPTVQSWPRRVVELGGDGGCVRSVEDGEERTGCPGPVL